MTDPTVAHIELTTVANLRDVGGWKTTDGRRVVTGRLFRSAALDKASESDRAYLAGLGIRTIYDLRSDAESDAEPDPVIDGVRGVRLDVLADAQSVSAPANLDKVLADPVTVAAANEKLADGSGVERMIEAYRELVNLPSALNSYRAMFRGLLDGTPALFHCTAGKDRTGWAAAAFLTLMGVDRDGVYGDYLLTNDLFLPAIAPVFDGFEAAGGDPELLRPLLGVQEAYLDAAFAELDHRFGTIENYFADGLGVDADAQAGLRERFLDA
ncbi:protein-tyrosine-phosphatase [Gordonia sp. SID5947]|uniref:tyrosine-protein phosphatase n=1 Tax=Gordonia sp. SID5947 TaxID=2690315 RepID=UPI00136BA862|nr:tyrosine-protein phosphatase [Gordonia sp. SID5947]MYR07060.1 protein-tyrosine-phosphatase [Gordonia sp. SID5947]